MRSSRLRVAHPAKGRDSLPLQPVPQRPRSCICLLWQRSTQPAAITSRRQQYQDLCLFTEGGARVLRGVRLELVLVKRPRRVCRLGFDSAGHAGYALPGKQTESPSHRIGSALVHASQRSGSGRRQRVSEGGKAVGANPWLSHPPAQTPPAHRYCRLNHQRPVRCPRSWLATSMPLAGSRQAPSSSRRLAPLALRAHSYNWRLRPISSATAQRLPGCAAHPGNTGCWSGG